MYYKKIKWKNSWVWTETESSWESDTVKLKASSYGLVNLLRYIQNSIYQYLFWPICNNKFGDFAINMFFFLNDYHLC